MISVLVRFRLGQEFNEERLRQIAGAARARFEGMPGLRSKAFTVDAENKEALNFYLWESEEAARSFFSQELIDRVTGLYGVRPMVQFAPVATLVDNGPSRDA
jgi:heme-degrading monooxygenase HmoA